MRAQVAGRAPSVGNRSRPDSEIQPANFLREMLTMKASLPESLFIVSEVETRDKFSSSHLFRYGDIVGHAASPKNSERTEE